MHLHDNHYSSFDLGTKTRRLSSNEPPSGFKTRGVNVPVFKRRIGVNLKEKKKKTHTQFRHSAYSQNTHICFHDTFCTKSNPESRQWNERSVFWDASLNLLSRWSTAPNTPDTTLVPFSNKTKPPSGG